MTRMRRQNQFSTRQLDLYVNRAKITTMIETRRLSDNQIPIVKGRPYIMAVNTYWILEVH
ncbi:hypothetical protein AB7M74_010766 [Bradyrhizobium japonicum]